MFGVFAVGTVLWVYPGQRVTCFLAVALISMEIVNGQTTFVNVHATNYSPSYMHLLRLQNNGVSDFQYPAYDGHRIWNQ